MEYIFVVFIALVVIGSIVSSVASMRKSNTTDETNAPKRKAKAPAKKVDAKPKDYQPIASKLNTDYSSRLTDIGSGDSTYDTVADIGDEGEGDSASQQSLVDFGILYGDDNGNMDVGALATAIVLGEVLGSPKGKHK